jgi:PAS domain S-box-containing protein
VSSGEPTAPPLVWRRFFELAPDPQIVTEARGRVLAANAAATRLLGSRECPLLGSNVLDSTARRDRGRVRALLRRLREAHPPALESEIELQTPEGGSSNAAVTLVGLQDDEGQLQGVGWALRLVGQPRTLARSLQRTRQEASDLRAALDQAAAILEFDRSGRIRMANERCTHLLDRPSEELVGCGVDELGLGRGVEDLLPGIRKRVVRGRPWTGELPVTTTHENVRWVNTTVVPLLDSDGRPRRYMALLHDVTARREAVERLEREKGLVRLGAMAAVVAHEVRNPLAAAHGALEIIGPRVPAAEDREVLVDVRQRLSQLNQLVNEILLYARPRPLKIEEHDLVALAARVTHELEDDPTMEGTELSLERPPCSHPLPLDEAAISGAILNLVRNASEAMEGRGRIHISFEQDEESFRLRVRDEGPGIPEDMREKVFEPFVSTRYRGSGLGLAISRNTAEAHGGALRLEPAPGGGTDAVLELPWGGPSPPGDGE